MRRDWLSMRDWRGDPPSVDQPNFWMEGLNKYRVVVRKDSDTVTISANTPDNEAVQWIDPIAPIRAGSGFVSAAAAALSPPCSQHPVYPRAHQWRRVPTPTDRRFPRRWMLATAPITSGPNYVLITNLAQLQANLNATAGKQLVVQGMVDLGGAEPATFRAPPPSRCTCGQPSSRPPRTPPWSAAFATAGWS